MKKTLIFWDKAIESIYMFEDIIIMYPLLSDFNTIDEELFHIIHMN